MQMRFVRAGMGDGSYPTRSLRPPLRSLWLCGENTCAFTTEPQRAQRGTETMWLLRPRIRRRSEDEHRVARVVPHHGRVSVDRVVEFVELQSHAVLLGDAEEREDVA